MEQEKERISFVCGDTLYSGYIVSSTDILPHFHWFMFEDRDVIAKYGDSIAFKIEDDVLIPMYHLTSPLFVQAVLECVQEHLATLKLSI